MRAAAPEVETSGARLNGLLLTADSTPQMARGFPFLAVAAALALAGAATGEPAARHVLTELAIVPGARTLVAHPGGIT